MSTPSHEQGARYRWGGWIISGLARGDISGDRLIETHEHFHRLLDDTTAFGGLVTTWAALTETGLEGNWALIRDRLQAMSDLVHEVFAVGMSLLATQRPLQPIAGYPMYDQYVGIVVRILGGDVHPWVAIAALRATATVCMQSPALSLAAGAGVAHFDPTTIRGEDRPNHRLAALLRSQFPLVVQSENALGERTHGREKWWRGSLSERLAPESMDGDAERLAEALHRRFCQVGSQLLAPIGATVLANESHHGELRRIIRQASDLAPSGIARMGALVENTEGGALNGGPLDSQTITLGAAPRRASVLPHDSCSGLSGEGANRHGFLVVVRPERLRASYELDGVPLPRSPAVACLRSTVYDHTEPDSILLVVVDRPESLRECQVPVYVSISTSALAAAPEQARMWTHYSDPRRLSLILDTPAIATLRKWCAPDDARFCTATQNVSAAGERLYIIAGRVERPHRSSALVVIPTTEFGARWFEAATQEDSTLREKVVVDPDLLSDESLHLDVVLNHLLYEEPLVGTGSWRG